MSDLATERILNKHFGLLVLEGYLIVNTDINSGGTSYYGFQNKDGMWYIQKSVEVGVITTYSYVIGASAYATSWTGRTGALGYNTPENIF